MRKITDESVRAFGYGDYFKKQNMEVRSDGKICEMRLHGNLIARRITGEGTFISNAGWQSNTTKERLNGVLDYLGLDRIYQKDYVWYLNGKPWDGKLIKVA